MENSRKEMNINPGTAIKTYPMFPLLSEKLRGNDRANALLEQTIERDLALDADFSDAELEEMLALYRKLYDYGIDSAVANSIRLISIRHIELGAKDPAKFYPKQAQLEYLLSLLEECNPELYEYYHALAYLFPIMYIGTPTQETFAEGQKMLLAIINEGNEYAELFGKLIDTEIE